MTFTHTIAQIEGLENLRAALVEQGASRIMVITGPSRRFVDRLPLTGFDLCIFDGATVHVPREVVEEAGRKLTEHGSDTLVTLGGGSATGLGKALCLTHDVRFVAIPTTYAGSERTEIFGIREGLSKQVGRDKKVRPELIVHEASLLLELPRAQAVSSLLNAMAHPISALSTGQLEETGKRRALSAIEALSWSLDQTLGAPSARATREALRAASKAAEVIDTGPMGEHHAVAHLLGGRFALDHAGCHAVLLPHFTRALSLTDRAVYDEIAEAAGYPDLPARLYDALTQAEAARSLLELGTTSDAFAALGEEEGRLSAPWLADALLGRRPSVHVRALAADDQPWVGLRGPELGRGERVVVALHGRGSNAGRMDQLALELLGHDSATTILTPQAPENAWYARSFRRPLEEIGAALEASLSAVEAVLDRVLAVVPPERVFLLGFSQGACLAAELVARRSLRIGGLVALSGARIGPRSEQPSVRGQLAGMPVLLGISEADPWVRLEEVKATAEDLRAAGAEVSVVQTTGEAHEICTRQRVAARELLRERSVCDGPRGFASIHESEALPGAYPRRQNTPRRVAYGLYTELLSGTGFTVARHENRRTWMYRIRPSVAQTPLAPLTHPTFVADWARAPIEPNLSGWDPVPIPEAPCDFIDSIATIGGQGHPALRRGFALHVYAANRSMEHRAFYDADGELLIVPQEGALTLQTELGILEAHPGSIAIIPRGLKFAVSLHGPHARGWIGETYGQHFRLPERGPVGSNGLSDARHFQAPAAYFEDRIDPGFRLTAKLGNALHEATTDHSPFDVVAWTGNAVPYVYDLADFCPVGNTLFDHSDPSIYTILSAPMDESGANALDFVCFPPRWDNTANTFRPAFFHRNAVTEFNGIISAPGSSQTSTFAAGTFFLTPSMTPHGSMARAVARALAESDEVADRPVKLAETATWFQFETKLPLALTAWARRAAFRRAEWPAEWGAHRTRFAYEETDGSD